MKRFLLAFVVALCRCQAVRRRRVGQRSRCAGSSRIRAGRRDRHRGARRSPSASGRRSAASRAWSRTAPAPAATSASRRRRRARPTATRCWSRRRRARQQSAPLQAVLRSVPRFRSGDRSSRASRWCWRVHPSLGVSRRSPSSSRRRRQKPGLGFADLGRRLAAAHGGASGSPSSPASSSRTCLTRAAARRSPISSAGRSARVAGLLAADPALPAPAS